MLTALVHDSALEPVETPPPASAPEGTIALPGVAVVGEPAEPVETAEPAAPAAG
jgi:hypothetical protein